MAHKNVKTSGTGADGHHSSRYSTREETKTSATQKRRGEDKRRCEDDGPHNYTPDLEYDATGATINCEFCGEPEPAEVGVHIKLECKGCGAILIERAASYERTCRCTAGAGVIATELPV